MEPFISVVTVSLNSAATIEDTLASVALQAADFPIEHICVDGGSRDATRRIIERWALLAPLSWVFEPDTGIFDAMNKGLSRSRGEYVLFLNADDFLVQSDSLASAVRGLHPGSCGNPDLIAGDACMGKLEGYGLWRHRRVPRLLGRLPGLFPVHQGALVKRRLLDEIGGFDARRKLASDVIQYYNLERRFRLSVRRTGQDLAFMRAGGAANSGARGPALGTIEIFTHLLAVYGFARAAIMVAVKSMQSASELRFGRIPHRRWFSEAVLNSRAAKPSSDTGSSSPQLD